MVDDISPDELPSKTQKKREAEAIQALGLTLCALSDEQRARFGLSERLEEAIRLYNRIAKHGAKRRQAQLVGKLMRAEDHEQIAALLAEIEEEQKAQSLHFHQVEQWRERLMNDADSLPIFIAEFKPESVQQLRQAIRKAQKDRDEQKNRGAYKALFRLLNEWMN